MKPKPSLVLPALYGGIIIGVLTGVPYLNFVNCCCCAGLLAGGILSVFFYKNDLTPDMPPLESSDGLRLGALAGAIGGVIGTALGQIIQGVAGMDSKEELNRAIEEIGGQSGTDAVVALMETISSFMDSPLFILASLVFSVFFCTVFGLLGGLIGYAIFKPRQTMMNMPPYQPPTQVP